MGANILISSKYAMHKTIKKKKEQVNNGSGEISGIENPFDLFYIRAETFVNLIKIFHCIACMKYGGMITVAHLQSYL